MKIAFYSAALGDLTLAEAAEWGRQAGFDGVEIDIARHVHDPTETAKAVEIARGAGLEVCAVTVFGNLLDQNVDKRNRVRDLVKTVLAEASKAAVPALVVFPAAMKQFPRTKTIMILPRSWSRWLRPAQPARRS